jgi:hypothetical protein
VENNILIVVAESFAENIDAADMLGGIFDPNKEYGFKNEQGMSE